MATIKDVANLAGVSVATVSNVVNNTKYVSEPLRERVLKAMKELSYRPNYAARSLKGKGSGTIAFIVPDITIPFFPEVLKGLEQTANAYGYNVILCSTDESIKKEETYLQILKEKFIDGIVISGVRGGVEKNEHILDLVESGIPTLIIDRPMDGLNVASVTIDNKKAAEEATAYLISLGHKKISFISGDMSTRLNKDRHHGYMKALSDAGIGYDSFLVREGDFTVEKGYELGLSLLAMTESPTAIFAANDLMALGAIYAAKEMGLRVPHDISVMGFDNISISRFIDPPLSTVAQPMREMGTEAFKLLYKTIIGEGDSIIHKVLPTELVIRHTTARYP